MASSVGSTSQIVGGGSLATTRLRPMVALPGRSAVSALAWPTRKRSPHPDRHSAWKYLLRAYRNKQQDLASCWSPRRRRPDRCRRQPATANRRRHSRPGGNSVTCFHAGRTVLGSEATELHDPGRRSGEVRNPDVVVSVDGNRPGSIDALAVDRREIRLSGWRDRSATPRGQCRGSSSSAGTPRHPGQWPTDGDAG